MLCNPNRIINEICFNWFYYLHHMFVETHFTGISNYGGA